MCEEIPRTWGPGAARRLFQPLSKESIPLTAVGGPPKAVVAAIRRVLEPLVRVLIAFRIPWPAFAALVKSVYVSVAEAHFALPGKPISDSRITLLTGVHRKDVSALRAGGPTPDAVIAASPSLGAQVLGRWLGDDAYRTPEGGPAPLPRTAPGTEPSFETLVTGISKDIRARVLLDELMNSGLVIERADGLLELIATAHLPRSDIEKLSYYYGRNLADHLAAAGHNLTGGSPPYLERAMFYDRLSPHSVARLRAEAERLGGAVLVELHRMASEFAREDEGMAEAVHRFTAGLYLFDEPAAAVRPATSARRG